MARLQQQHSPRVCVFTIALALLLVWPAWIAARNGLSGLYARPAINHLQQKRFDADTISEAEWQAIDASIRQAAELMPGNSQYLEALGWLQQLKLSLFADDLSIEDMDAHANAAMDYFQQAVANRPTWPYYWGNLALEHYRRGNYASDAYSLALANAAFFGPWKNDTQRLVMDLGSETWEFLSPRARRELILNLERGLHRQPQNTIRIVQNYDAWPQICQAGNALVDIRQPYLQTLCAQQHLAEKSDQF